MTRTSKFLVGAIALLSLSLLLWGFAWKPTSPIEKNKVSVVLTQVHNHITQSVPSHIPIYIQLPSDPVIWSVDKTNTTLPVKGPKQIPSPSRIAESKSLSQFETSLSGAEPAIIAILPSPASEGSIFEPFEVHLTPMDDASCWRDCLN